MRPCPLLTTVVAIVLIGRARQTRDHILATIGHFCQGSSEGMKRWARLTVTVKAAAPK